MDHYNITGISVLPGTSSNPQKGSLGVLSEALSFVGAEAFAC